MSDGNVSQTEGTKPSKDGKDEVLTQQQRAERYRQERWGNRPIPWENKAK